CSRLQQNILIPLPTQMNELFRYLEQDPEVQHVPIPTGRTLHISHGERDECWHHINVVSLHRCLQSQSWTMAPPSSGNTLIDQQVAVRFERASIVFAPEFVDFQSRFRKQRLSFFSGGQMKVKRQFSLYPYLTELVANCIELSSGNQ